MGSRSDFLNVLRGFIGTTEQPPGSNHNWITEEYATYIGYPHFDGAWCCMSQSVGAHHASIDFTYAYVPTAMNAARAGIGGLQWIPRGEEVDGDLPVYNWDGGVVDHIEAWEDAANKVTLGGNVHDSFGRWHRAGDYGFVVGSIRLPFSDQPAAPDLPPPSQTQGRPWLRQGNSGSFVRVWQVCVSNATGAGLTIDGDFGPATDQATRTFQQQQGLGIDGVVGPQTWAAMDRIIAYVSSQAAPQPPPPVNNATPQGIPDFLGTVRLGSTGRAVVAVQYVLISRGWRVGAADGIFGRTTDAVVRQFQAEKGLTVDGIVGPQTWVALCTAPIT